MEPRQQLEKWSEQVAAAGADAAADMDVAKRLLKHSIEALNEIDRLRNAAVMPLAGTPLAIRFDALDESQAMKNHGQTLARLRERGGLDLSEAAAIREKRKWEPMTHSLALHVLSTPNAELRGASQLAGAASRSNAGLGEEG
jgi:hypothetical protein